jgi:hypothetical protein
MIEILQARSEAYSSWSEKNVNALDHAPDKARCTFEWKSIDRMSRRENSLLERLLAGFACGKAEDESG